MGYRLVGQWDRSDIIPYKGKIYTQFLAEMKTYEGYSQTVDLYIDFDLVEKSERINPEEYPELVTHPDLDRLERIIIPHGQLLLRKQYVVFQLEKPGIDEAALPATDLYANDVSLFAIEKPVKALPAS